MPEHGADTAAGSGAGQQGSVSFEFGTPAGVGGREDAGDDASSAADSDDIVAEAAVVARTMSRGKEAAAGGGGEISRRMQVL